MLATSKDLLLKTIKPITMKRMITTTALAFTVMLLASVQKASAQAPPDGEITYQQFYDDLDPYGQWMDNPDYGYVWRPDLGADFQPYSTNGHWVWSDDYEWMWVSDYDWGWAPFHYGRWFNDPYYGWMWMPGYEWSPAWVAWRDGGDYYGWAPIRPGINISIGFSLGSYNPPVDYWCFAPRQYITSPRIWDYCAPRRNNITIINQTTIINNYNYGRNIYRTGPGRRDAERYAGRINPVRFRESNTAGRTNFRGNEVSMFRPRVQRDNDNRNFAPRRVQQFDRNRGNDGNAGRGNSNNLPSRRDGNNDRRFDQNSRGEGDHGITDRRNRRFERPENNNTNTPGDRPNIFDRNNDRRNNNDGRMPDRRNIDRQPNQVPNTNPAPDPNNDRRNNRRNVFDRNNSTPNTNNNPRQFERRDWGNNDRPQRQTAPQQQPQQPRPQMEQRRFDQPRPRMEQPRMEQRRIEQPQQPRQFEHRNDNGGQQGGGNQGGGNRGGRGGGFGRR
jgi:hypothetical protein